MKCPKCKKENTYLHSDHRLPEGNEIRIVNIYCIKCDYIGYTKIKVTEIRGSRKYDLEGET